MVDYTDLSHRIAALCEHETNEIALMATIACEVHHSDDRFDWTGFYRVTEPQVLKIGPYQGQGKRTKLVSHYALSDLVLN